MLRDLGSSAEAYFCDSDEKNEGKRVMGVEVVSPIGLKKLYDIDNSIMVIITSTWYEDIKKNLEELCFDDGRVYTAWAYKHCILANLSDERINANYRKEYLKAFKVWRTISKVSSRISDGGSAKYLANEILLKSNFAADSLVMVYTGSRVGTRQLENSLRNNGVLTAGIHYIKTFMEKKDSIYPMVFRDELNIRDEMLYFYEKMKRRKMKIICAVREPLMRDLSGRFTTLDNVEIFEPMDTAINDYCEVIPAKTYEAVKKTPYGELDLWFDEELLEFTGIDVYEYPFDYYAGYSVISHGQFDIFIAQTEKINNLQKEIGRFLEKSDFNLASANTNTATNTTMKKYAYEEFKEKLKLPKAYYDFYYNGNNRFVNHFYSPEDIEKYKAKWSKYLI